MIERHAFGACLCGVRLFGIWPDKNEGNLGGGDFLVMEDGGFETFGLMDFAEVWIRTGIGRIFHGGERALNAAAHLSGIDVTHHDEGHALRYVVAAVEIDEALARC